MLAITSKQRAYLRAMNNVLEPTLYIGKENITPNTVTEADLLLEAREIIKCAVQRGAQITAREACETLAEELDAAPVQYIGNRFCLYRPKRKSDPVIQLPR